MKKLLGLLVSLFLCVAPVYAGGWGGGGVSDGDKGDITISGSGATFTIDNGVVTLSKMADMATTSLLGRNTGGTGVPEVLSASTARSLLGLVIGTNVQAYDADLGTLSTSFGTASASTAAFLDLHEDTDNGSNRVRLIGPASTADVTVTLPAATDTLVGKDTTDTLTNKTIDGASNTLTIRAASDVTGQLPVANGGSGTNWVSYDPENWFLIQEEFNQGGSSGTFGKEGWTITNSGASAATGVTVGTGEGHSTYANQATGSTDTGRTAVQIAGIGFGDLEDFTEFTWKATVRIPTLADTAGEDFDFYAGLGDASNPPFTDGIYFKYDKDTSDNWLYGVCDATACTEAAGSVAVSSNSFQRLRITWDDTTATFYVDGTSIGTVTGAALPDDGENFSPAMFALEKEAGTTARTADIDYCFFAGKYRTAR